MRSKAESFKSPLVILVGPTGVGKTETAIRLAKRIDGEIISADSRYFYRGMDIGTAKPDLAEREEILHHLIDVAEPDETWSLAVFQKAAQQAIENIHNKEKLPILVGGTGQYVRAVVEGWDLPEQAPDQRLRDILEKMGKELGANEFHRRLARVDAAAAGNIEPNNLRRTVRAWEVLMLTGERFSTQRKKGKTPYRVVMVGLARPREELYERIDARIDQMLADGWLDEVRNLLAAGYGAELPGFSAIGYRELAAVVEGMSTLEDAVVLIRRKTRQFVRRQANWFKPDNPAIRWFRADAGVEEQIEEYIRGILG